MNENDHWIGNALIYPSIWMEAHTYARRGTLSSIDWVTFRLEKGYFSQFVHKKSCCGAFSYMAWRPYKPQPLTIDNV